MSYILLPILISHSRTFQFVLTDPHKIVYIHLPLSATPIRLVYRFLAEVAPDRERRPAASPGPGGISSPLGTSHRDTARPFTPINLRGVTRPSAEEKEPEDPSR